MKEKVIWHIDPDIFDNSFNISMMGIQHSGGDCIFDRPHGMDDFLFILFHTPAQVGFKDDIRLCEPNTLVLWPPGASQYYGGSDIKWSHSWLLCNGIKVREWLSGRAIPCQEPLALDEPWAFDWYLQAMHAELTNRIEPSARIICNFAENFIMEIQRSICADDPSRKVPADYLELRSFMDGNYLSHLSIPLLAARVNQSIPHFCRQFKKWFSVSPMEYVYRLRLHHAANLLDDPNLLVGQVARMSGYNDEYYFSRAFKRHFGASPSQMRRHPMPAKQDSAQALPRVRGSHSEQGSMPHT